MRAMLIWWILVALDARFIAYMPDGSCYPCDEARMQTRGYVQDWQYSQWKLWGYGKKKKNLLTSVGIFLFRICGITPLFIVHGSVFVRLSIMPCKRISFPKCASSAMHKILTFQFEYIFNKILDGGGDLRILNRWVEGKNNALRKTIFPRKSLS